MNNNSKNNTQTKLTLGERINNFFNITTEERRNNITRYIHISFISVLALLLVWFGVQKMENPVQETVVVEEVVIEEEPEIEDTEEPEPVVETIEKVVISYNGLNVREQPSVESNRIGVLYYGDLVNVIVTDNESEWLELEMGGFINAEFVETYDPEKVYELPEEFLNQIREEEQAQASHEVMISRGADIPPIVSSNTYAYYTDYVNTPSGLTELDVYNILNEKGPALASIASDIVAIERDYGINAFFTMAVAAHESWWGRSDLAVYNNNLFGLKNSETGTWYGFSNPSESVYLFARSIIDIYFPNGLVTPWDINPVYCPGDGGFWATQIVTIMNECIASHNSRIQ